ADFNKDGNLDFAVTLRGANEVRVLLGNGDGTFQGDTSRGALLGTVYDVGTDDGPVAVADLNGDGNLDLVTARDGVSVLSGNGDGSFQPAQHFDVGGNAQGVVVGDFDGDTRPDVAVADFAHDAVSVLLSNADGTLQPPQNYPTDSQPTSLA